MSLGRLWRTVRPLNLRQWTARVTRRGGHLAARAAPAAWSARQQRRAEALALPDPDADPLAAIAGQVLVHQRAVHGDHLDAMAGGRFTLLGHTEDFGSIDTVDWRRNTADGNGLLWRLNLGYMGYAVPWLADGSAAAAAAMVRTLEAQNPWTLPGVFRDIWNPYTASHRLINLLAGLRLQGRAGVATENQARTEILSHVRRCAALIAGNLEQDLQFNHLLKNLVALAVYAAALPAVPPAWRFLEAETLAAVEQNFLADGGHAERSPMYHLLGLQDLRLLRATGLYPGTWLGPLDVAITKAEAALGLLSHPDGDIALFNDAWFGEAPPASAVAAWAPGPGRHDLPETGYVRLDGDGDAVIYDVGPCGPDENPAHAHADFLSLEASVGGRRFLVDPGTAAYAPGERRDRCRSAAQHNGPHVAGAEPIEFWHAFRVGRRGRAENLDGFDDLAPLAAAGRQDGYARLGIDVRRFVGLWPGQGMVIVDAWDGPVGARAATRLLVPADWQAAEPGVFSRDGTRVRIEAVAGRAEAVEPAVWWPRFGAETPAHAVTIRPEATADGAWSAVRFSWGEAMPEVDAGLIAVRLRASR